MKLTIPHILPGSTTTIQVPDPKLFRAICHVMGWLEMEIDYFRDDPAHVDLLESMEVFHAKLAEWVSIHEFNRLVDRPDEEEVVP